MDMVTWLIRVVVSLAWTLLAYSFWRAAPYNGMLLRRLAWLATWNAGTLWFYIGVGALELWAGHPTPLSLLLRGRWSQIMWVPLLVSVVQVCVTVRRGR